MAYPTIVASSSAAGDADTGAITLPAGIQSGDRLLIGLIGAAGANSLDLNETTNDGGFAWSSVFASSALSDVIGTLYTKTATGSESNQVVTFSFMNSVPVALVIQFVLVAVVIRDALAFNFANAETSGEDASDTDHTCNSIAIAAAESLFMVLWGIDDGANSGNITADGAQTEIVEAAGTGLGAARAMLDYSQRASPGETGTRTISFVNAVSAKCAIAFEIKTSAPGGGAVRAPMPMPRTVMLAG